jgi:preprotein translocase subunit YajC
VDGLVQALVLLGFPLVLIAVMTSRSRREYRRVAHLQERLAVGQDVMTSSGLIARIAELDADIVVLETAPRQYSRWDRRAVVTILDRSDPAISASSGAGGETPTDEPPSSATPPAGP